MLRSDNPVSNKCLPTVEAVAVAESNMRVRKAKDLFDSSLLTGRTLIVQELPLSEGAPFELASLAILATLVAFGRVAHLASIVTRLLAAVALRVSTKEELDTPTGREFRTANRAISKRALGTVDVCAFAPFRVRRPTLSGGHDVVVGGGCRV